VESKSKTREELSTIVCFPKITNIAIGIGCVGFGEM